MTSSSNGRAGGREEKEIGEKQALVGAAKCVAVSDSSDGIAAAGRNEGGQGKWGTREEKENNALNKAKCRRCGRRHLN